MPGLETIAVEQFMTLGASLPVFDVRTPAEFAKGHIPGAYNLPLFSDEERALVGTTYHRAGREAAMLEGLSYAGPKMRRLVEAVQKVTAEKTLLLHCWRGGMRSNSVGWLLNQFGYDVFLLKGGYKAYRRWVLQTFALPRKIVILSGPTGSGKSEILHNLREMGEQVIDLEGLACHKGSSFGSLGEPPQPPQQQFENELASQWRSADPGRPLWLEDESQKIGSRMLPQPLWEQMRLAPLLFLDMPLELRIQRLLKEYGSCDPAGLREATERLRDRMGGLHTQKALQALERGDLAGSIEILLRYYYDKTYQHGLSKHDPTGIFRIEITTAAARENAEKVLEASRGSALLGWRKPPDDYTSCRHKLSGG